MIRAHSGTITLSDGTRSVDVPFVDGEFIVQQEPPTTREVVKLEGSFTFTTSTMTVARRSPPIGALRRWARSTSRTPWRRRSIASWRWAWREAHALTATVMAWGWSR